MDDDYPLPQPHPRPNGKPWRKGRDRDRQAFKLAALGWPLDRICEELGLGDDTSRAAAAIRRAAVETVAVGTDEMRRMELAQLEMLQLRLWRMFSLNHILVQQGRVIRDDLDMAIPDHRMTLEVIDRLLKIGERKAKLLGLDAPTKTEIYTPDGVDAEIKRLEAEVAANRGGGVLDD